MTCPSCGWPDWDGRARHVCGGPLEGFAPEDIPAELWCPERPLLPAMGHPARLRLIRQLARRRWSPPRAPRRARQPAAEEVPDDTLPPMDALDDLDAVVGGG